MTDGDRFHAYRRGWCAGAGFKGIKDMKSDELNKWYSAGWNDGRAAFRDAMLHAETLTGYTPSVLREMASGEGGEDGKEGQRRRRK